MVAILNRLPAWSSPAATNQPTIDHPDPPVIPPGIPGRPLILFDVLPADKSALPPSQGVLTTGPSLLSYLLKGNHYNPPCKRSNPPIVRGAGVSPAIPVHHSLKLDAFHFPALAFF
jgi:hypothetical protein